MEREISTEEIQGQMKAILTNEQKELILDILKYSHQIVEIMPESDIAVHHRGFIKFWGFLEEE